MGGDSVTDSAVHRKRDIRILLETARKIVCRRLARNRRLCRNVVHKIVNVKNVSASKHAFK